MFQLQTVLSTGMDHPSSPPPVMPEALCSVSSKPWALPVETRKNSPSHSPLSLIQLGLGLGGRWQGTSTLEYGGQERLPFSSATASRPSCPPCPIRD